MPVAVIWGLKRNGEGDARGRSRILARSAWLAALPDAVAQRLLERTTALTLPRGRVVWDVGDPPDGLYGLLSGCVQMGTIQSAHGPTLLNLFHTGAWLGEAELVRASGRITSLTVLRESQCLFLRRTTIKSLGAEHPEIWRALGTLAVEHLMLAVAGLDDLTIRTAEGRLVAVLLRLCSARLPDLGEPVQTRIDVTQSELARMANMSRSAVGTMLEDLERRGLLRRSYARIEIKHVEALVRMLSPTFVSAAQ